MRNTQALTTASGFEFGAPLQWLRSRLHNWRIRRKVHSLAEMDDRILQDIGITREDIYWASRLPLTENAAFEMDRIARLRRSGSVGRGIG